MAANNKPMLTPLHVPWTRVSWISGSDLDEDLDEEEVQEVESITLGRAFSSSNSSSNANASTIVSSDSTDEGDRAPAVTLKPFSFEDHSSGDDSENSSVLAPFVLESNIPPDVAVNNSNNESNNAPSSTSTQNPNGDLLVSPKGDLITPAAKDAVTEEDTSTTVQKRSSWKSLFAGTNQEEQEDEAGDTLPDVVEATPEKEVLKKLWKEDEDLVVEPEDDQDQTFLATQKERLEHCWEATGRMAARVCQWIVDALTFVWVKWIALGIQLNTWILTGASAAKNFTQDSANKALAFWDTVAPPTLVGPAVGSIACGLGLGLVAVVCMFPTKRTPSPTSDLRDFVRYEKAHNVVDLKVIDELNTEAFRTYARSTCVEAASFEQARHALDMGLYGVPDGVRSTIVQMAILEGVTQKNSVQDSNSDFVNSGKADAFMAFWSTVYDPSDTLETYKTCVMVTGVALTVAETVAEWTTKREKYQVGTEPCQCGYVYCEECPVFDVREVRWPVFERRSLSLKKQEELRRWMVDQAIRSAEHLVLDGSDKLALGSGSSVVAQNPSFTWTGQTSSAFFGEDSHSDRAFHSSSSMDDREL